MIGSLNGKITLKKDKFLIVETTGVGYKVNVSLDLISKTQEGQDIKLYIYTHVREDTLDLYGFQEYEELEFFELLLGVSGIGPRGALTVLDVASLETLRKAIGSEDTGYLTKISGIGKKTAQKIVIELKDKVGTFEGSDLQEEMDALEALKAIGYKEREAREALKEIPEGTDTNAKIHQALKILGGNGK